MYSKKLLFGISARDIDRVVKTEHSDPHSVLGAHPASFDGQEGVVVRVFHPDASAAYLVIGGERLPMEDSQAKGLFWYWLPGRKLPLGFIVSFQFSDGSTWECDTPYRFLPTLGEQDLYFAGEGKHYNLYDKLGAHVREMDGVKGTSFAIWAPNARRVSVIGNFNNWDGRLYAMRSMGGTGIWEIFVQGIGPGELYKYEIKTRDSLLRIKTDPFAFFMELRPGTGSIVWNLDTFQWQDGQCMKERQTRDHYSSPMSIYEVHLGSWLRIA